MPPSNNTLLSKIIVPVIVIIFFFTSLFLYTKLAGPIPFNVSSVVTNKTDIYTVSGEGKANIKPDSATVSVGVQAQGSTAKLAQELMNQNINKVIEAIKTLGVGSDDIKTQNYNVYPNYDPRPLSPGEQQKITSYTANTNITIKVKEADKGNQVLDAATSAGANQIGGVSFDAEDKTKAENEARAIAVKQAKEKAEQTAKIAGFKLGRLINYSEGLNGEISPMYESKLAQGRGGGEQTNLEPGSEEVTITVNLSYEIN